MANTGAVQLRYGHVGRWTRKFAPAAALLGGVCISFAVLADECSQLAQEDSAATRRAIQLVADYPGTHLVIGTCGYIASQSTDPDGGKSDFMACAVLGCAFAGIQNCMDVVGQWFGLVARSEVIKSRRRKIGCAS